MARLYPSSPSLAPGTHKGGHIAATRCTRVDDSLPRLPPSLAVFAPLFAGRRLIWLLLDQGGRVRVVIILPLLAPNMVVSCPVLSARRHDWPLFGQVCKESGSFSARCTTTPGQSPANLRRLRAKLVISRPTFPMERLLWSQSRPKAGRLATSPRRARGKVVIWQPSQPTDMVTL